MGENRVRRLDWVVSRSCARMLVGMGEQRLGVERRVGIGRLDRLLGVFFVSVLGILRVVRWVLGGL